MHRAPTIVTSASSASVAPSAQPPGNPWSALTEYLAEFPDDSVILSFGDIEEIIGTDLPNEAASLGYWSNSVYNTMAKRWWDAGFRTSTREVPERCIRFDRVTYTNLAS